MEWILASGSPRRRELLGRIIPDFSVQVSQVEEQRDPAWTVQELPKHLALQKALDVSSRNRSALVIGADTIVSLDGMVLGKPRDEEDAMDMLREGVGLRAYGQRDPAVEYKFEGYEMFENMVHSIQESTLFMLYHLNVKSAPQRKEVAEEAQTNMEQAEASWAGKRGTVKKGTQVGRNDPCPCGSGKKYKNCCGKNA